MWDRVFDHYIHEPMQKIVTDRIRPEGKSDPYGVEQARVQIREAYALIDREIGRGMGNGRRFFAGRLRRRPVPALRRDRRSHRHRAPEPEAYLDRLIARPSFARVLTEAEPYFKFFPMETKPRTKREHPRSCRSPTTLPVHEVRHRTHSLSKQPQQLRSRF